MNARISCAAQTKKTNQDICTTRMSQGGCQRWQQTHSKCTVSRSTHT
jgi:hypothetical protein